jgi:hypothetical protein
MIGRYECEKEVMGAITFEEKMLGDFTCWKIGKRHGHAHSVEILTFPILISAMFLHL